MITRTLYLGPKGMVFLATALILFQRLSQKKKVVLENESFRFQMQLTTKRCQQPQKELA